MNNYEAAQRKRNLTVGVFIVTAIMAFVWLLFKFGDLPIALSKFRAFPIIVQFATAPGVQKDTPVRFCGYQIGRVVEVQPPKILEDLITGKFYHQSSVTITLDNQYLESIPSDVRAKLMTRGLGSSYIELKLREYDIKKGETDFLKSGSTLQGSTGITSEFFPEESQAKLDQLANNIQALVVNTNEVIGDAENKQNFKDLLKNISDASAQATATLKRIEEFSTAGVELVEQLTGASAQLSQMLEKINSGEGSAGKFVNDGRLYESLLESTEQMQILIEELKLFVAQSREKGLPLKLK